jgi:hypothetical protein
MISNQEKKKIYSEILPYNLYYESDLDNKVLNSKLGKLADDFESKQDFLNAIYDLLDYNNDVFANDIRKLNDGDFIKFIQKQHDLYKFKASDNISNWINFTKFLVMDGKGLHHDDAIKNVNLRGAFAGWYNEITINSNLGESKLKEIIKPDNITFLHPTIFNKNAFEVWESMFKSFEINEKSRTDVKFIFEEMRKDGLIHKTINQKTFLEWITDNHDGLIVEKTSNHSRSKERIAIYNTAKSNFIT